MDLDQKQDTQPETSENITVEELNKMGTRIIAEIQDLIVKWYNEKTHPSAIVSVMTHAIAHVAYATTDPKLFIDGCKKELDLVEKMILDKAKVELENSKESDETTQR